MSVALRGLIRRRAGDRCEYCGIPQEHVAYPFQIEHIVARQHRYALQPTAASVARSFCDPERNRDRGYRHGPCDCSPAEHECAETHGTPRDPRNRCAPARQAIIKECLDRNATSVEAGRTVHASGIHRDVWCRWQRLLPIAIRMTQNLLRSQPYPTTT